MREKVEPPPNESQTYSSGNSDGPPDLRLVHYNDVYHVDSSSAEPVGGAARFMTLMEEYRHGEQFQGQSDLLTFFSGDAFNPSLESSITKGNHMHPILNNIGTDAASLGNHDLDFGVRQFSLPPDLIYKSASETAKELVPKLREEGAEIVIAITHMREPNDNKLAEQTDGIIDIILGGHDHYYNHSVIKDTHVLRSGTDFKQLSYLEARRRPDGSNRWDFNITRRDVTSAIPKHEPTVKLVEKLTSSLNATLQKPVGYTAAPLDARFRTVRLKESNIGNFVCDIMRHYYSGDCCIMASGTIRGDQVYVPGPLLMKDIMNCFPFEDPVVVIKASGKNIWLALENSVSQFPALEGRFPQVSNIEFSFDSSKPAGDRIVSASIGGEPIDLARKYVLVTRGYMGRGKDGYDSLLIESEGGECEEVVSEENGILISMMLRQYFLSLRVMGKWKNMGNAINRHWDNVSSKVSTSHPHIAPLESTSPNAPRASAAAKDNKRGWDNWTPEKLRSRRASVGRMREEEEDSDADAENDDDGEGEGDERRHVAEHEVEDLDKELQIMRRVVRKWSRVAGVHCRVGDELKEGEFEIDWTKAIAPRIEGRIVMVGGRCRNEERRLLKTGNERIEVTLHMP
ncbi:hypothetical protein PG991_001097 [Apiospora marii]|uniref:5'-Nucleotidase C-terminal domain-containing protein n=1 Tax=Apiospora marii TaxID=335849 RepID=A0ABR1STW4_9PEZI